MHRLDHLPRKRQVFIVFFFLHALSKFASISTGWKTKYENTFKLVKKLSVAEIRNKLKEALTHYTAWQGEPILHHPSSTEVVRSVSRCLTYASLIFLYHSFWTHYVHSFCLQRISIFSSLTNKVTSLALVCFFTLQFLQY